VPVILSDIFGDPNVGIFSFANEKIAVLPAGTSNGKPASFKEALGIEAYGIGVADSRLVGIYLSGNSNSILMPYIATDEEISRLRSTGVQITIIDERRTALGNIILCNDYGAVVDPRLKPKTVSAIEKALKVPVKTATIGGLPQIGSLATASNK
jgi:translation initiation factor 6